MFIKSYIKVTVVKEHNKLYLKNLKKYLLSHIAIKTIDKHSVKIATVLIHSK